MRRTFLNNRLIITDTHAHDIRPTHLVHTHKFHRGACITYFERVTHVFQESNMLENLISLVHSNSWSQPDLRCVTTARPCELLIPQFMVQKTIILTLPYCGNTEFK